MTKLKSFSSHALFTRKSCLSSHILYKQSLEIQKGKQETEKEKHRYKRPRALDLNIPVHFKVSAKLFFIFLSCFFHPLQHIHLIFPDVSIKRWIQEEWTALSLSLGKFTKHLWLCWIHIYLTSRWQVFPQETQVWTFVSWCGQILWIYKTLTRVEIKPIVMF